MAIDHPSYNGKEPIRNGEPSALSYPANKGRIGEEASGKGWGRGDQKFLKQGLLPIVGGRSLLNVPCL